MQDLYFEDLELGFKFTTPTRTVTEADIVNFAGMTGDYNLIHTDAEYAKNSIAGQRFAHGMLVMAYVSGLSTRTMFIQQLSSAIIAMLEVRSWKFLKPVVIGDTIRCESTVVELLDKGKKGIMVYRQEVKNQRDEVTQSGDIVVMLAKRN